MGALHALPVGAFWWDGSPNLSSASWAGATSIRVVGDNFTWGGQVVVHFYSTHDSTFVTTATTSGSFCDRYRCYWWPGGHIDATFDLQDKYYTPCARGTGYIEVSAYDVSTGVWTNQIKVYC